MADFLTRAFVWLAMLGYGSSTFAQLLPGSPGRRSLARVFWSMGCLCFIAHVVLAFQFFYQWSHETAFREVARQTVQTVGIESGAGIYANYAFTLLWILDCSFWWFAGDERYMQRPMWIHVSIHAIFLFMIFNGAILFAHGPVRWLGVIVIAGVVGAALFRLLAGRRSSTGSVAHND